MRTAYFLIGLFVGSILTANASIYTIEQINKQFDNDILAYVLTGYSEGWTRGRDYTTKLIMWRLIGCSNELNRLGQGK